MSKPRKPMLRTISAMMTLTNRSAITANATFLLQVCGLPYQGLRNAPNQVCGMHHTRYADCPTEVCGLLLKFLVK